MALAAPGVSITATTSQSLLDSFKNALREARFTNIKHKNEGFTEFTFLGFPCRSPLEIENILGPKFIRNFDPTLKHSLQEVKNSPIDKTQMYPTLLNKYGIDISGAVANSTTTPIAYHSVPSNESEDYLFHLYFLQPFRLFSITENNRKYISSDPSETNREWLWVENSRKADSAPLFRKIIQIYLLTELIEDYRLAVNPFEEATIRAKLPELIALHGQLLNAVDYSLTQLLSAVANPVIDPHHPANIMRHSSKGLLEGSEIKLVLDTYFPGYLDVMALYPLGRLLFGQTAVESHHAIALHSSNLKAQYKPLAYGFAWLFSHLNLTTSAMWLKTLLVLFTSKWKALKKYITDPNASITDILLESLLFIPSVVILICTPILMLLPPVYGLTTLPFTLMRSYILHGTNNRLKDYRLLMGLDAIEGIKDVIIFCAIAAPILTVFAQMMVALIPASLLGFSGAFGLLIIISLIFAAGGNLDHVPNKDLAALRNHPFTPALGLGIFLGLGAFFGTALIGRFSYNNLPPSVLNSLSTLAMPFQWIGTKIEALAKLWFDKPILVDLQNIIPVDKRGANIELPKAKQLAISEAKQTQIDQLQTTLGRLNQLVHLSLQRKQLIGKHIENLDVTENTTPALLDKAILDAQNLIANNLSPQEAQSMQRLLELLEAQPQDNREKTALRMSGNTGNYQPSWNVIDRLYAKGVIKNGKWNIPADQASVTPLLTPTLLNKIERIKALPH